MQRLAYTVAELAEATGASKPGLYRAVRNHELPFVKLGGRIVIPATVVDRLLRDNDERHAA